MGLKTCTAALIALVAPAGAALHEPVQGVPSEEPSPAVFLREDGDVAHALGLAEGYERIPAWREAAEQYQKVLDAGSDVLVPVDAAGAVAPESPGRYEGARWRALRRLAAWPPEGRRVLSEMTEAPARTLWEHAGADPSVLRQIATRFPFSPVGEAALDRLGDVLMESGDAAAACACWEGIASAAGKRRAAAEMLEGRSPVLPSPWQAAPSAPARPGLPRWTFPFAPEDPATERAYARSALPRPLPCLPLPAGDAVLLCGPRGVTLLDRDSGRIRWTSGEPAGASRLPSSGPYTAAVAGGLCLAVVDEALAAFEMQGGRKAWQTPPGARVVTPPAVRGTVAYVGMLSPAGAGVAFSACALDARDGRLLWRRHVISTFDKAPLAEGLRGGVLLEGNLAVFATDMGCVMAVDALTGDPRWLLRYDALKEGERRMAQRSGRQWGPSPPVVSDGALLLAPRDAAWLLCLSVSDGALRWREPRRAATALLGVAGGRVILSGPDGARAVALADHRPLWEAPVRVLGRGCLGPDGLVLPAAEGPAVLDPATGRILHQDRWPDASLQGGNLVAGPGLVLACTPSRLHAFEPERACRERLEAARDGTDGGLAALRLGCLALQQGDAEGALEALSAARLAPSGPLAEALAEAGWQRARTQESRGRWAEAAATLERVAAEAPTAARRIAAALRAGEDWRRAGDDGRALAAYQRVLADPAGISVPWRFGVLRADWAARLPMEEILRERGRGPYAPIEAEAADRFRGIPPGGEDAAYRRILSQYPHSAAAGRAALALGRLCLARHAVALAVPALSEAARGADPEAALEAAKALDALGAGPDPVSVPLRLAWRLRRGLAAEPPPFPPADLPLVVEGPDGLLALDPGSGALRWSRPSPRPRPPAWAGSVLMAAEDDRVTALDPKDGRPLWTLKAPARVLRLWTLPGLAMAETLLETVLIEPGTGRTLGRLDLGGPLAGSPLPAGGLLLAVTTSSGTVPARAHWLDPRTGKVVAVRDLGLEGVGDLLCCPGEGLALVLLGSRRVLALPLDPAVGTAPRWEHAVQDPLFAGLAAGRGRAVLLPLPALEGSSLKALDLSTGRSAWETPTGELDLSGARTASGSLLSSVSSPGRSGAAAWDLETGVLRWRSDLWPGSALGSCLPFPGGVLLWASGQDEAAVLDAGTGRVLRRLGGMGDPPLRIVPFLDGVLWIGERALAAYLPADELDAVRGLWRVRALEASAERADQALALADACFRAGAYEEALDALRAAGLSKDPAARGEFEARALFWRQARAVQQPTAVQAPRLKVPPEIDGDLRDGWAEHLRREVLGPVDLHRLQNPDGTRAGWEGDGDLSARLYVAWDDECLYFALDVDDQKQVVFNEKDPDWRGDLLLFALDARGDGTPPFQGGMAIQNPRQQPPAPGSLPPGDYAARRRGDDTGTVYEGAIPWRVLRGVPATGSLELRMNLLIADDDGEGIRKALSLAPGLPASRFGPGDEDNGRLEPAYFVRIRLTE